MRKVMFALVIVVGAFAVLVSSDSADAATLRCGSSWELCAQRGRGPGHPHPTNIRDNIRRGLIQPGAEQIRQQQR